MATKEQVKDIIVKLLRIKPEELKEDRSLEESLGVDSTEMVEVCIALQKAFGVSIQEKEVAKSQTIEQIAGIIDSKKKA
jgi:acyl carrier protein